MTNKNSKNARESRGRYSRKSRTPRRALPVVAIVCDDTVTAPQYFRMIAQSFKGIVHVAAIPARCKGATARQTIEHAEEVAKGYVGDDQAAAGTKVWALIDVEGSPQDAQAALAAKSDHPLVCLARSKPCFDLWLLLHLVDTGQAYADCPSVCSELRQAVLRSLGQRVRGKTEIDPMWLRDKLTVACANARKHKSGSTGCWTEVHKVIESIERFEQQQQQQP